MGTTQEAQPPPLRKERGIFPPEVKQLLVPPLKVGAYAGAAGVFAGAAGAIAQNRSLAISGALTGVHWFTIGSSYYFTRTMVGKSWGGEEDMSPTKKIALSSISGLVAGSFVGVGLGARLMLPSILSWGGYAAVGQLAVNGWVKYRPWIMSSDGKWLENIGLMKKMSNEEYEGYVREKILGKDADIALVNERIADLRLMEQKILEEGKQNPK